MELSSLLLNNFRSIGYLEDPDLDLNPAFALQKLCEWKQATGASDAPAFLCSGVRITAFPED